MAVVNVESGLERRVRLPAVALAPLTIALVGAVVVFVLGLLADRPITFPDEVIYGDVARNLAAGRGFSVAGTPFSALTYGPLYPLLLAPLFRLAPSLGDAYFAARALNALLFASGAIPVWLIARRVVTRRAALFVTVASVALPASVYSTKIQTESLAYPVVMWTVLATLRLAESPTRRRQLLLLGCLAVAPFVRFQLLALTPAVLGASLICIHGTVVSRVRRLLPVLLAACTAALAVVALLLVSNARGANETHGLDLGVTSLRGFIEQFGGILAALDLYTGIVPFCLLLALVLGAGTKALRGEGWAAGVTRSLAVVTCSLAVSLAAAGALYLASIPPRSRPDTPPDRYAFYVAPLMLILFARWIEHGAPRSGTLARVAPFAAALPVLVAATQVHGRGLVATSNALSFMPWMLFRAVVAGPWWLIALGVYSGLAAAYAVSPRVGARRLVRLVGVPLVIVTLSAFTYVSLGSWSARGHTPPGGWLDARSNAPVVGLWLTKPTDRQAFALWEVETMNRNLRHVYYVRTPDKLGPATRVSQHPDGRLLDQGRPIRAAYVLTASGAPIAGRLVDRSSGLALYRVDGPLRVR